MSNWRRLQQVCLAAVAALVLAGAAFSAASNGGASIAAAPPLPLDQTTASGWTETAVLDNNDWGEFWRLSVNAGDRFIFDLTKTANACVYSAPGVMIYSPAITDFTLATANPVFQNGSNASKYESVWVAPSAGSWALFVSGCPQASYTFLARVQQFTTTSTQVPSLVQHAHAFKATGTVSASAGPVGGKVQLRLKGPGLGNGLSLVASIASGGRYVAKLKLANAGTFTLRVVYYGDAHHRSSSATAKIHVG